MSLKDAIRAANAERLKQEVRSGLDEATYNASIVENDENTTATETKSPPELELSAQSDHAGSGEDGRSASAQLAEKKAVGEKPTVQEDELVGLNVRVTRRQRLHWLIEAKRNGTTLTAAVTEGLNARFGEPGPDD